MVKHIIKIIKQLNKHTNDIHKTQTQVLSHNQILSTTWASIVPCYTPCIKCHKDFLTRNYIK